MFPCFTGERARRKQPENSPIAETRRSNEREDSLNTVKRTIVISARTLVPMCDGQDEKAGHAAQAHAGGGGRRDEEVLDLDGPNYEGSDKKKNHSSACRGLFFRAAAS